MDEKNVAPRMLITITNPEKEKYMTDILKNAGMPAFYRFIGLGTAPSALMDMFGLSGRTRLITAGAISKENTDSVFRQLEEKLSFSQKGRGIAFTLPVTGLQSQLFDILKNDAQPNTEKTIGGDEKQMKETAGYVAIFTSVNGGYAEDVMDAARRAGARGGTIIKGVKETGKDSPEYFGIPFKSEQELVLIIVTKEEKKAVMTAIGTSCGIKTDAHGLVLSMPIDEVIGIE
ncbi:MAG: hypothetical protein ACI4QZ_02990 [Eubacteriales bacterium]